MLKKYYNRLQSFTERYFIDEISTYSAQASYFIILSIFPFILLLLMLIQYLPLDETIVLAQALEITPDSLDPLIESILRGLFNSASGSTLISITAILTIWSSSKGILAMIRGMNSICGIRDRRNYFLVRLMAALYTVVFLAAIVVALVLQVFGRTIYNYLGNNMTLLHSLISFVLEQRSIISFLILSFLFLVVYKFLPAKHLPFFVLLPGAVFSSIGWMAASFFFSVYLKYFPNMAYLYGSLTTFILLMLWIYADMYILFLGAWLNVSLNRRMAALAAKRKDRKNSKKTTEP